jgi:TolB-like protein/DNA-binding winged helix-turn-helix (wHTH) protein/Flp pilus assembly protein TadD
MLIPGNDRLAVRFGPFDVDLSSGEIHKHGHKIKLQEQPFQVLAMLLEHPGRMITRDELRLRLWPADTFVDFDTGLNSAIKKLRDALGDAAAAPTYIETLPRRGYRFISAVETPPESSTKEPIVASPESAAPMRERGDVQSAAHKSLAHGKGLLRPAMIGTLVLVAAATLVYLLNLGGLRQKLSVGPSPPKIQSLAVLPLENLTGDPTQEYFSDGMTDELITDLAKISSLRVISRTSIIRYKGTKKPLPEIGRELNVDAVVEGTVMRAGNRVRITAQLIHATTDKHLWAEEYEGDLNDILKLQGQVAQAIKNEIQVKVTPQEDIRLANAPVVNPDAHEAYLKGHYYMEKWSTAGTKVAIGYFQQAIEKDPKFALGYAGLAECYTQWSPLPKEESVAKAKAAAMKAMELDETLGEAHASLALIMFLYDWNLPEAEKEFKRAIELNPSYGEAHHEYSHYLMQMGRTEEALTESNRFLELDPLSPAPNLHLGWSYLFAGKYDQAIGQLQKTLKIDPHYVEAHSWLGQTYEQKKMYQDALAEFQKALDLSGGDAKYRALLGHVDAMSGKRNRAQAIIAELQARGSPVSPYDTEIAIIYTGLGNRNKAFDWLGKTFDRRSPYLIYFFRVNPMFDSLHSDPRYADLLRRIGLPPREHEAKSREQ